MPVPYCTQCGISLEEGTNFCRKCGESTGRVAESSALGVPSYWTYGSAAVVSPNTGKWIAITVGGIFVVGVLVSLVGVAIVRAVD